MNKAKITHQNVIRLGTIVQLEEQASNSNALYILAQTSEMGTQLINIETGKVWSYDKMVLNSDCLTVYAGELKSHCEVEFHIINHVCVNIDTEEE
jgi:hypothetical protein